VARSAHARSRPARPTGGRAPKLSLQAQLDEAQQAIEAICNGDVDALVVRSPGGERVYTLESADRPYRVLVEEMAQGAATLTGDGYVVYANPRLRSLLEVSGDALVGASFASLFPEQDRAEVERLVLQACAAPCTIETRLERGARSIPVQVSASPLALESMAMVALVTDLTAQKENAYLAASREALQRADRQKDEFLASLAHELRNPLAPIRNTVTILATQLELGSPLRPAIEVIGRQVEQMALLLDDLLDVSQLTRGAMVLRRDWVALQDVVDAAVETSAPVIAAARHQLSLSLPSERLELYADSTRLAQAFANVLNNAARYTDPGGRVWLSAASTGDGFAEVRVKDTGIGIGAEALGRIFDMFAQGPDSERPGRGGLGIGLSLVRGLVALHGGTIQAASPGLGLGAEFVIRLPLAQDRPYATPAPEEQVPAATGLRILVADDNQDNAESLAMLLMMMGHEVRTALDGAGAVEAAAAFRPQAVLLDLGMPKLNGYEAARRIRALPGGDEVVLIAQSGWSQPEDRRRSREAGFDHHVIKPIPSGLLERLLGRRRVPGLEPPPR
jgi:two-component system CheB/CheR fusion protein